MPVLDELCSEEQVETRDFAEATRLRATALYLLSREAGIEHSRAADIALEAARRTDDPELVTGALFEYARSGLEAGDDRRLGKARQELVVLAGDPKYRNVANAWYALGFCHYSAYDLRAACTCVQRAIGLLEDSRNVVALSLAHNALGVCKYSLCEFAPAIESLTTALELARRMGDDVRVSITAANLTTLHNLAGNFADAVRFGCISVEVGAALPSHPRLTSSYTNLAEAYVLSGQTGKALECLERAARWVKTQRSWRAHIDFLSESANMALIMRNVALALELIQSLEITALGREGAVPEAGMFEKLRLWRLAHTAGVNEALEAAVTSRSKFRDRHPLYFLEVLAVEAWLQRREQGTVEAETKGELQLFLDWGATGLKTALTAQGFLD
jgi:tetratricopeptide (TPR) repeat protein